MGPKRALHSRSNTGALSLTRKQGNQGEQTMGGPHVLRTRVELGSNLSRTRVELKAKSIILGASIGGLIFRFLFTNVAPMLT